MIAREIAAALGNARRAARDGGDRGSPCRRYLTSATF
jgi:hypothetical protein